MKHVLVASDDGPLVVMRSSEALKEARSGNVVLQYATRTGALLRVEGVVRGAFDREHHAIVLAPHVRGELTLEVERESLPASGLPAGEGVRWRWYLARSHPAPAAYVETHAARAKPTPRALNGSNAGLALVGHAHLDVAWLWTYEAAARKAERTFATAVRQLEGDPSFVFAQSQPQLYAFVEQRNPALFGRVRAIARTGRFDASVAALWVEPDCNLPGGESLLRQLVFGIRYAEAQLGTSPSIAWLPDSFGFANTLPTLLVHAGIGAFATTKLGWNDTTRFPYARFAWDGPDGSRVLAAQIASIEGAFERGRVRAAERRGDLLLVGHGDGGGGASDAALANAAAHGHWTTVAGWFETIGSRAAELPVVRDELYVEEHRGVATTQHEIKAGHAALERALHDVELALAWAKALHASPFFLDEAQRQLRRAWEIVLRAEFHDVLPGTSLGPVYEDVRREFEEANALIAGVAGNARSVLPHAPVRVDSPLAPGVERGSFVLENELLFARVRRDGTLAELRLSGGRNLVRRAARLALYVDRPKRWDAWNIDRTYSRRPRAVRVTGCEITDGGLEVRYQFGSSLAVGRFSLVPGEPFLRFELAIEWREQHRLLRLENDLAFAAVRARFGTPHGAVERTAAPKTRAERAKFEAPGQRFARIDGDGDGLALLALDTYGWSVGRRGRRTRLGHSLLRGPTWPDPAADRGEHAISLAFVPYADLGMGELEAIWERFAREPAVPMFTCDDPALLVVATKPADDGDGIIVRVRECDGAARAARIRCGVRARSVACVDALERPVSRAASLDEGEIRAAFGPYELRTFRIGLA